MCTSAKSLQKQPQQELCARDTHKTGSAVLHYCPRVRLNLLTNQRRCSQVTGSSPIWRAWSRLGGPLSRHPHQYCHVYHSPFPHVHMETTDTLHLVVNFFFDPLFLTTVVLLGSLASSPILWDRTNNQHQQDVDVDCSFCRSSPELTERLLWSCHHVTPQFFWQDVRHVICRHSGPDSPLSYENVFLFGFFNYPSEKANHYYYYLDLWKKSQIKVF